MTKQEEIREAKDTMILRAIQEAYNRKDLTEEDVTTRDRVVFEAGIREVVEEIDLVFITTSGAKKQAEEVYSIVKKWQAKLKEWGIK